MIPLLLAFTVSTIVTLLLVRSAEMHAHRSGDRDFHKPQGFHAVAVPRIGGIGILLGLVCAAGLPQGAEARASPHFALSLLACATPAFLAGIVQDFTESLTPRGRLLATAISAMTAFFVLGAGLPRTDIPGLDWVASYTLGSLACTVVAVAGIANAVNIIDGFNGLASMCVVIMLAAVAYVAFAVGDSTIALLALAGVGAVLGFFVWNFPAGLIFLGDGGAYFLGFFVAELLILLIARNDAVSPLFALLVCIYPVVETLFSIYRRSILRASPPSMPDGIHLHSLVYRRVLKWAVGARSAKALTRRNSLTSPFLWLLCSFSVAPAVVFWDRPAILALCLALFVLSYICLYWRIVRFKSPRWLRVLAGRTSFPRRGDNRPT